MWVVMKTVLLLPRFINHIILCSQLTSIICLISIGIITNVLQFLVFPSTFDSDVKIITTHEVWIQKNKSANIYYKEWNKDISVIVRSRTNKTGHVQLARSVCVMIKVIAQIARFMWPTWGPPGTYRPQMGPTLAPWTLLSGCIYLNMKRR